MFSAVTNGVMSQRNLQGMRGAWGDPNNDGALDFYAGPTWSISEASAMYWNDGQGNFVRQPVGPSWTSNHIPLQGVLDTWGDFDRDGFLDAFLGGGFSAVVSRTVTNSLLHNNGDGTFAVVTNSVLHLRNDGTQYSCAVDYDNDGALDLVPVRFTGLPTQFYHNDATWAELLEEAPFFRTPIPRFGSSDYRRSRTSHLFYTKRRPSFRWFDQKQETFQRDIRPQQLALASDT
jgi:hypothetical protein